MEPDLPSESRNEPPLSITPPDSEIPIALDGETSEDQREGTLSLYRTLPSSSYSSLTSYQMPQVREFLEAQLPGPLRCIVDATAHIGGDAILFSNVYREARILAIDSDPHAIECLRFNIHHFADVERFEIIQANSVEWIRTQGNIPKDENSPRYGEADFYYFDPPWGGPRYYTKREISLFLNSIPIADIINTVFTLGLTKKVLLKIPRNFAYPSFKAAVKGTCKLHYIKKPQKNGSVCYGLILISDDRCSRRTSYPRPQRPLEEKH